MLKISSALIPALAALAVHSTATAAAAQIAEAPAEVLARNLRIVARQPSNVSALVTAGRAALKLGDAAAAGGFFGRANELAPSNPSVQAGLGATLVAMGRPSAALAYFSRAQRLGAAAASIGCDRGLAYDLLGNQAAAQADYVSALAGNDEEEARRRLALSLAISGDQRGALRALEPLLAQHDRPAARARALVLALGGDFAAAAAALEEAVSRAGAGADAEPFLRQLPLLAANEKAAAVNLGIFPTRFNRLTGGDIAQSDPGLNREEGELDAVAEWQGAPVPAPMEYGARTTGSAPASRNATPKDPLVLYGVFRTP
jgi:tetratricopeptide (TPR) repeat protein